MPTVNIKDITGAKIVRLVDLSEDSINKIAEAVARKIADPIKHGHWLFYEEPDGYYHSECSECGQWCDEDVFLKDKWHYCPNCGAKMYEADNGSD